MERPDKACRALPSNGSDLSGSFYWGLRNRFMALAILRCCIEGAQMGSSRRDRDIAKLRKNSQHVNRQIWLRSFA